MDGSAEVASTMMRWYARPGFFVGDIGRAIDFYVGRLGFVKKWHEADGKGTVCQADRNECEIILAQEAQTGSGGLTRPNHTVDPERSAWDAYVWVEDADALSAEFTARGVLIARPIRDQPYGCRDFEVEDCNGYRLCFGHDIEGSATG